MKASLKFLITCGLLVLSRALTGQSTTNQDIGFADVIDQIRPTIAIVETQFTDGTGSSGTGFFVNQNGYVVTANHVVSAQGKQVRAIMVSTQMPTLTSSRGGVTAGNFAGGPATVVSADEFYDVAILLPARNPILSPNMLINGKPIGLAKFAGFDTRTLRDGEGICTSGYPLASRYLRTTSGKIASREFSSVDPRTKKLASYYTADIQVNPGNSGGPVFDGKTHSVIGLCDAYLDAPLISQETKRQAYGIRPAPGNTSQLDPLTANSGLAVIIPSGYITDLLRANGIEFRAISETQESGSRGRGAQGTPELPARPSAHLQ
jgi:S1-C subfamily serine protease